LSELDWRPSPYARVGNLNPSFKKEKAKKKLEVKQKNLRGILKKAREDAAKQAVMEEAKRKRDEFSASTPSPLKQPPKKPVPDSPSKPKHV
jgi:septal ring factor EnvC (AmiA/AmiB activator)